MMNKEIKRQIRCDVLFQVVGIQENSTRVESGDGSSQGNSGLSNSQWRMMRPHRLDARY